MIINSRLKGLVELDDALRKAERGAAQQGDPASVARHAVQRLRAGESVHDIVRPHIDHYVAAVRHRVSRLGHPDEDPKRSAEKGAAHHAHAVAEALGVQAGSFLTHQHVLHMDPYGNRPHYTDHSTMIENHLHAIADLHGATWKGGFPWHPERQPHDRRAVFPSKEHANSFKKAAEHHYPKRPFASGSSPGSDGQPQHDVRWNH